MRVNWYNHIPLLLLTGYWCEQQCGRTSDNRDVFRGLPRQRRINVLPHAINTLVLIRAIHETSGMPLIETRGAAFIDVSLSFFILIEINLVYWKTRSYDIESKNITTIWGANDIQTTACFETAPPAFPVSTILSKWRCKYSSAGDPCSPLMLLNS